MLLRNVKTLLLALFVAGCATDEGILEPKNLAQGATANSAPGFGRVVTSLTINGSAAPATISVSSNQMLAVVVGGFTTMDQVITTWLSTSVTFTAVSDGSTTRRCNDVDVWTDMIMPGSNLSVSFSAQAPSAFDSYVVTVQAHQEDACSAVFPSEPFPTGADQITLNVVPSNTAPILAAVGNQSVDEHANLTFSASATDSDVPAQTLQFSIDNAATGIFPSGATMTPSGEFSWTPNETQGPGTYRVKVIVSDGALADDEEIQLTVAEVNAAPALTLPPDIITQWGMAVPNVSATASDPDLPANALAFAKVSGPSWVQVGADGTISFGTLDASSVGVHTVRIRVTDDGSPALSDEADFTLTVQARPTAMTYQGRSAGQYSDKSTMSATLTDAGVGALNGTPIANAAIDFNVGGVSAGSATTDAAGLASGAFPVGAGAGSHSVVADFKSALGYAASSATAAFAVSQEDALLNATFPGSTPLGFDLTVTVSVSELLLNGAEPTPNDGALAGDIGKVAAVAATITGINSNAQYQAACGAGSGGSASYASTRTFNCTFAGASLTTADVYALKVTLPTGDLYYRADAFEAHLSIWDPNGGSASGGGSFNLGGDRVTFAFNSRPNGGQGPRSQLVVVRHLADGGVCQLKSSDQMNPGVVGDKNVTVSGKGEYRCVGPLGNTTVVFADVNIWLTAEDNGTPGAGLDRIWISNNAPVAINMLDMPHPVSSNSVLLTGGNVTVKPAVAAASRK